MRILDRLETRYVWPHGPLEGRATVVPSITIENESIPPLAKASSIFCRMRDREAMERSTLCIQWNINNTDVGLKLWCSADDKRLRAQYCHAPEIATKVVDFLADVCRAEDYSKPHIKTSDVLQDVDLPRDLLPFVAKARIWESFIKAYQNALHMCTSAVSSEGYLLLYIRRGSLWLAERLPGEIAWYFRFDPVLSPPTVTSDLAFWEFPLEKVVVVLLHESTDECIATHFKYLEVFRKWQYESIALQRRMDEASKRNDAEDVSKLEEAKSFALKSLLSP